MSLKCPYCGESNMRLSKFRVIDILHLLALMMPVRCHECRERYFFSIRNVLAVRRKIQQKRALHRAEMMKTKG